MLNVGLAYYPDYSESKTDTIALGNFLSNVQYTVPAYQRAYVWSVNKKSYLEQYEDKDVISDAKSVNVEPFIEYLIGGWQQAKHQPGTYIPCHLGAATLLPMTGHGSQVPRYEVVDGQQRITTLVMLIVALKLHGQRLIYNGATAHSHCLKALEQLRSTLDVSKGPVLEPILTSNDSLLAELLRDTIEASLIDDDGILEDDEIPNRAGLKAAGQRIHDARARISEMLEVLFPLTTLDNSLDELAQFIYFLQLQVVVDRRILKNHSAAVDFYTNANSKGIPLTSFDILRNECFRELEQTSDWDHLASAWTTLDKTLPEASTQRENFLHTVINATWSSEFVPKKRILDWVVDPQLKKESGLSGNPVKYVHRLEASAEQYNRLRSKEDPNLDVAEAIKTLTWLGIVQQHIPLLMASQNYSSDQRARLVEAIRRLVVAAMVMNLETRLVLEHTLSPWTVDMRQYGPHRFDEFLDVSFNAWLDTRSSELRAALKTVQDVPGNNKQRKLVRYLLSVVEVYMRQQFNLVSSPIDIAMQKGLEVEHILPQSDDEDRADIINGLGNLVLLNKSGNAAASNKPFSEKSRFYQTELCLSRSLRPEFLESASDQAVTRFAKRELPLFEANIVWDDAHVTQRNQFYYNVLKLYFGI